MFDELLLSPSPQLFRELSIVHGRIVSHLLLERCIIGSAIDLTGLASRRPQLTQCTNLDICKEELEANIDLDLMK